MSGNIKLEIVTPEKSVVSEDVQMVVSPGSLGDFGVLTGHTPFLTTLRVGAIRYVNPDGTERSVFVSGGFAEALPDKVTILAESAERRRDIDLERAQTALERAQKRLEKTGLDNINYARAKAAITRALHRVNIGGSRDI